MTDSFFELLIFSRLIHQTNIAYKYKLQRKPIMKQIQIDTYFQLSLILMLKNTVLFSVELKFLINDL